MSNLTDSQRDQLWKKFRNKAYRDAFVSSHISTNIAAQIHAIREARGWTQTELADASGMAQTRISVMEDPSYDRFALRTLKRLASAFDVALVVRFVPFSELLDWASRLSPDKIAVQSFSEEQNRSNPYSNAEASGTAMYGENIVTGAFGAGTQASSMAEPLYSETDSPALSIADMVQLAS